MGQMTLDWDGSLKEGEQPLEPEDLGYKILTSRQFIPYQRILRDWEGLGFEYDMAFVCAIGRAFEVENYFKIEDDIFYMISRKKYRNNKYYYFSCVIPIGSTKEEHIRALLNDLRRLNGENMFKRGAIKSAVFSLRISKDSLSRIPEIENVGHLYAIRREEGFDEYVINSDRVSRDNMAGRKRRPIRRKVKKFIDSYPKYEIAEFEPSHIISFRRIFRQWHKDREDAHGGRTHFHKEKSSLEWLVDSKQMEGMFMVLIDDNPVGIGGITFLKGEMSIAFVKKYIPKYEGISDFITVVTIERAKELGYKLINDGYRGIGNVHDHFKGKYALYTKEMYLILPKKSSFGDSRWDK